MEESFTDGGLTDGQKSCVATILDGETEDGIFDFTVTDAEAGSGKTWSIDCID